MEKIININPSVATTVNISPIIVGEEKVPVIFTFDELITDEFEVKFWNSNKKNVEVDTIGEVKIDDDKLTMELTPTKEGSFFYEIINKTQLRVYFKGQIEILN